MELQVRNSNIYLDLEYLMKDETFSVLLGVEVFVLLGVNVGINVQRIYLWTRDISSVQANLELVVL